MIIYRNVTEQELNNLGDLAEQKSNQRTSKLQKNLQNKFQHKKIAESFKHINRKTTKTNDSSEKSEERCKKPHSEEKAIKHNPYKM